MPQPNLVPARPSWSRNAQSNGVSSGASTCIGLPLICNVVMANLHRLCPHARSARRPGRLLRWEKHRRSMSATDSPEGQASLRRRKGRKLSRRPVVKVQPNEHLGAAIYSMQRALISLNAFFCSPSGRFPSPARCGLLQDFAKTFGYLRVVLGDVSGPRSPASPSRTPGMRSWAAAFSADGSAATRIPRGRLPGRHPSGSWCGRPLPARP